MSNSASIIEQQLQSLLSRLEEVEHKEADLVKRMKNCIRLCHELLASWRQAVVLNGFPDQRSEIYFFKQAKPQVVARYRYYQNVLCLNLGQWKGGSNTHEQRLMKEMTSIEQVFERHRSLWEYYRSGAVHHDEAWFVRGQDLWLLHSGLGHFDEVFSTRCDGQIAELLAAEMCCEYIGRRLAGDEREGSYPLVPPRSLQCTAPAAHATVLGLALHRMRFFNQGQVTKKTVMEDFQSNWNINLSNHCQIIDQVKRQNEPDRFLRDLLDGFNDFLAGKE